MSYEHHGRNRTVSTPFEIDDQIHIRLAVNGFPHEAFVLPKFSWQEMTSTAPDEGTLLASLVPYAEFSTSMKKEPEKVKEKWSAKQKTEEMPKWMQEAAEIWGLSR